MMLKLRPYKKCDAKEIVKWFKDEHIMNQWSANCMGAYPLTEEKLNAHYEEQAYSGRFFAMTALDDTEVVGASNYALYCYKSVGFAENDEAGWIIPIGNEQRKCICMELVKQQEVQNG